MRVAALYDLHGNVDALDAVLADLAGEHVDAIVIGGDVVGGPFPRETLDRVRGLGPRARLVSGNGDREVVEVFDGLRPVADEPVGANAWVMRHVTRPDRDLLASFEASVSLPVDGLGPTLFCHASPRSDEELLTPATPRERWHAALEGVSEGTVVCGHVHVQFEQRFHATRVVNPGSVGMPYADLPGAYWALLGPEVELRRTVYDLGRAAERIRALPWDAAVEFADANVRSVPTAEEAIEAFERIAAGRGER